MTEAERQILITLATAWNLFLDLPIQHGDDVGEFRSIIHAAQEKVMARLAARAMLAELS
jgi:hypothetical protein